MEGSSLCLCEGDGRVPLINERVWKHHRKRIIDFQIIFTFTFTFFIFEVKIHFCTSLMIICICRNFIYSKFKIVNLLVKKTLASFF